MKFKVGDKVRVRDDLVKGVMYDDITCIREMLAFQGKVLTIDYVADKSYSVEENCWSWSDAMLEPAVGEKELNSSSQVDIHKIINEAIEKKDRTVHIFIMGENISVDVKPLSESDPRWIVHENKRGYSSVRYRFECSECRASFENPAPYCQMCGEKLRMPIEEDFGDKAVEEATEDVT